VFPNSFQSEQGFREQSDLKLKMRVYESSSATPRASVDGKEEMDEEVLRQKLDEARTRM
jgi:hypothetical protein